MSKSREPAEDQRVVITQSALNNLKAVCEALARTPIQGRFCPIVVADVSISLGPGTWQTDPAKPILKSDEVVFKNENRDFHIRLKFTSPNLNPNPFKIVAGGTGTLNVGTGVYGTGVALQCMPKDGSGSWQLLQRTGNGADMGINNP